MARNVTLSNVREAIRTRYELPTFSSSTWVTTTQINALINASLQALYGMLIEAYGDNYFTESTTLTTTADVNTTSLPSGSYKLVALWWVRGTDDVVRIRRADVDDMRLAYYSSKDWNAYGPKFRLLGASSIQWLPTPSAAYDVRCVHVKLPSDLSADGDTFEAGAGWEEWVVNDVCAMLAAREEKDPSLYLQKRADAETRIRQQAPERDEGSPLQIRDTWHPYVLGDYDIRNRVTREEW